jgi:signal transduction histidine kinase
VEDFQKDISLISAIAAVPTILDVICRTTGMGFAAVARVTEARWIACTVRDEIQFGLKPGDELKIDTTICHEIRMNREAVVINHVDKDDTYGDHPTPRMYGFQSYISMPIFLQNRDFFGTLCAIDPRPALVNSPEILGMFKLFAELIAFHIDAADRLEASESKLLAEREASELREQFIAVLGHDLRNPLGAISTGAMMLGEIAPNPQTSTIVGMMRGSITRMAELIDDVMDFARGRLGGGITVHRVSDQPVEPVLDQVINEIRSIWRDRTIEMDFQLTETFRYDPQRLAQLFTNLLSNAMTHGKPDTPVRVRATSSGGTFELSVANAAEPIPAATLQRLFHPFSRAEANQSQQGLGLGLYIASEIAKAHGGTLEAASTVEETRFTFSMPVDQSK